MHLQFCSRRTALAWSFVTTLAAAGMAGCSMPDGPAPEDVMDQPAAEQPASTPDTAPLDIAIDGPGQLLVVSAVADIKGERFDLEVARTRAEQSLGLMYRPALPDNRGMLFPFGQARRASFWMKNVPVPLDIVFIRNGVVIEIAAEVPPCEDDPCPSYGPGNELVDTVLELRSGRSAEIGLQAGDTVTIQDL